MSLSSAVHRNDYVGNGSASTYAYNFPIFLGAESNLVVTVRDEDGIETTLVYLTDYTVSGAGSVSGGNVVLVNASQPWLTGGNLKSDFAIAIRRVVPLTQTTSLRNEGAYFPEIHENEFDHCVMIDQQQQDDIDRSMKAPVTDSDSDLTLPSADERAGQFLGFDEDGNPIALAGVSEVPVSDFMATVLDDVTSTDARATLKVYEGSDDVLNLALDITIGANALTLAVKTRAGLDPSTTAGIRIAFPFKVAGPPARASFIEVRGTSAVGLTVPSGTTLGTASGAASFLYVYAISAAASMTSAIELAISTNPVDEGLLQTTTAISGGATAGILYSATARTSYSCRLIGRLISTQAAAGTWASVPQDYCMRPFRATFPGSATNDSAMAGYMGEIKSSVVSSSTNVPAATGVYGDATSLALTPGDWNVSIKMDGFDNGATITAWQMGLGTAAGTSGTGVASPSTSFATARVPTSTIEESYTLSNMRVSIAVNTTYYAKLKVNYSVATPQYRVSMTARRVR